VLVYFLGRAPYEETWALQERLRAQILAGGDEALLLCEHPPIVTLGRSAAASDVLVDAATLAARGIACLRTSRGGQVTYHGPGQLVAYPVVRLRRGVVAHVEWLAAAAVEVAQALGVPAEFRRDKVGVFVGSRKLAAIGVQVSRRVAIHGMALNVTSAASAVLSAGWFIPCGQAGGQAISLEEAAQTAPLVEPGPPLSVESLAEPLAAALCRRAGLPPPRLVSASPPLLSQRSSVK
jgi:lipoyl(octanoyl) transferase